MEEEELVAKARATVAECHPEHLLQESKFLLTESLQVMLDFPCVMVGKQTFGGGGGGRLEIKLFIGRQ